MGRNPAEAKEGTYVNSMPNRLKPTQSMVLILPPRRNVK